MMRKKSREQGNMDVEPHVSSPSTAVILSDARYRIHDVISQPRRGPTSQLPHVTHVPRHDGHT
jgi:hypothetical protein